MDRLSTFLARAGYERVDTPMLEQRDLFLLSFEQELWQNLYTFRLHHRDLCLRPEYTASICRLYLDHYQRHPLPIRFQYAGPVFRYEAPGRERYRQHTQLGVELFGGQAVSADAEILQLACDALNELHIPTYRLELGHIGVASSFIHRLNLDDQAASLLLSLMEQISRSAEGEQRAQARIKALYPENSVNGNARNGTSTGMISEVEARFIAPLLNSISISFDDEDARHEVIERFLWKMERGEQRRQMLHALEFLHALHAISGPPPEVFEALQDLLGRYELDPRPLTELEQLVAIVEQTGIPRQQILLNLALGRGVSYYTGLVFEIHAQDADGFDTQLCGGGRYDHLMRAVGSTRDISACGFAFGIERLLSLLSKGDLPPMPVTQALVIPVSEQERNYALQVARSVRKAGVRVEVDVTDHGVSGGLRQAAKKHIQFALIVGDNEQRGNVVTVRDLTTRQERVLDIQSLLCYIAGEEQHV